MKKPNLKKVLSLLFTLALIFTMVPFSAMNTFAEGDVIVINSIADWNTYAGNASTRTKSVKLMCDLDFTNAELKNPWCAAVEGDVTFDGNGHSIKNASISNRALLYAYSNKAHSVTVKNLTLENISVSKTEGPVGIVFGWMSADTTIEMDTVVVKNSHVTVTGNAAHKTFGLAIMVPQLNANSSATFHNCTIENCTIQDNKNETVAPGCVGGFVGLADGGVTLTDCTANGFTITANSNVNNIGGMIGKFSKTASIIGGTVSGIKITSSGNKVGGLIGYANGTLTMDADKTLSVSTIKIHNTGEDAGGLIGYCDKDLTVKNVNVDDVVIDSSGKKLGGLVGGVSSINATLNVCHVTNIDITKNGTHVGGLIGSTTGQTYIGSTACENVTLSGNYVGSVIGSVSGSYRRVYYGKYRDASNVEHDFDTGIIIRNITVKDAADDRKPALEATIGNYTSAGSVAGGHLFMRKSEIPDASAKFVGTYVQRSIDNPDNLNKYALRFAVASQLTDVDITIEVIVKNADGTAIKKFVDTECALYDVLIGNKHGIIERYEATKYGAEKFAAITVFDIPTGEAYTFEITASYVYDTTLGNSYRSTTYTARFDDKGSLITPKLLEAPLKEYRIVVPTEIKDGDAELLGYVRNLIRTQTGVDLPIVKDSEPAQNYEITIGATNREGSAGVVNELLNYTVKSVEKRVAIGYGGKMALWAAAHDLIKEIRNENAGSFDLSAKATETYFTSLPTARTGNTTLRVMSANVLVPNGSDPGSTNFTPQMRGEILSEYILALDPDSIGFQELLSSARSVIMNNIGSKYDYVSFDNIGGGSFVATVYNKDRFTLEDKGWIELDPNGFGADYVFTWVLLKSKTDGSTYIQGNLHYHYLNTAMRLPEAEKVNTKLKELLELYPDVPMVVTGDYNCRVDSSEMSTMIKDTPLLDATKVAPAGCADVNFTSFHKVGIYISPKIGSNHQIDHVTVNTNTTTVGLHRIIHDDLICYESDHYPILVDFSTTAGTTAQ